VSWLAGRSIKCETRIQNKAGIACAPVVEIGSRSRVAAALGSKRKREIGTGPFIARGAGLCCIQLVMHLIYWPTERQALFVLLANFSQQLMAANRAEY